MFNLPDGEREDFASAIGCVDAKGEQAKITRIVSKQRFNLPDGLEVADRLDLDRRSLFRAIFISSFRQELSIQSSLLAKHVLYGEASNSVVISA